MGKGKVFIYKGKPYTTNYAEEEGSKGSAPAGSKSTEKAPVKADLTDVNPNDPNYAYMLLADERMELGDEGIAAEKQRNLDKAKTFYMEGSPDFTDHVRKYGYNNRTVLDKANIAIDNDIMRRNFTPKGERQLTLRERAMQRIKNGQK